VKSVQSRTVNHAYLVPASVTNVCRPSITTIVLALTVRATASTVQAKNVSSVGQGTDLTKSVVNAKTLTVNYAIHSHVLFATEASLWVIMGSVKPASPIALSALHSLNAPHVHQT
jgi:hypothetical protein